MHKLIPDSQYAGIPLLAAQKDIVRGRHAYDAMFQACIIGPDKTLLVLAGRLHPHGIMMQAHLIKERPISSQCAHQYAHAQACLPSVALVPVNCPNRQALSAVTTSPLHHRFSQSLYCEGCQLFSALYLDAWQ